MSAPLDTAAWRKASYSHPNDTCVAVARPGEAVVGIRDSKAPLAGRLEVTPSAFDTFLNRVTA
jgi:hypothetical protein